MFTGHIHPAFALNGARTGEDMLMSGAIGFDVKGYDPSVPIYYIFGPDGAAGTTFDPNLGASGSDDLVVSPNDPGYPFGIAQGQNIAGRGDFVDLAWGPRVFARASQIGGFSLATTSLFSQLSGYDGTGAFTNALFKSGLVVTNGSGVPIIYQPTYDTWSERYEIDGQMQSEQSTTMRGTIWRNGLRDLNYVGTTDGVNTSLVDLGPMDWTMEA